MLLKFWYKNPVNNYHNLTYQKGNGMSKEQTDPIKDNFKKAEKAFKIGTLVLSATLTALQIVSAFRDDEPETVKL